MDGTSLLLARRTVIRLPLQLGPVTIGLTLPQCPQQALRSMLQPRDPAAIRLRVPGAAIDCPVILVGPLPKGSISARTVNSGAKMADLRRHMHEVCRAELRTVDVRLVGRYEKDRSPMFLYMEFGSADAAHHFGSTVDRQVPQEFARLMMSLCGDKASQMQFWSCNLLSECLAAADEKALKELMSHGQNNPCPHVCTEKIYRIAQKNLKPRQKNLKVIESSRAFLQRSQVLRTFIPNGPILSDVLPSAHPPRKIIFYRSRRIGGPGGPAKKSKISI